MSKVLPKENEVDQKFPDFTNKLYSFLKVPRSELFQDSKYERVKQLLIIIAGTMGIGKSTLVKNIIKEIQKEYTKEKVNAVMTQVGTKELMEYGFLGNPINGWNAKKPIQIMIFDDATSNKLTPSDQIGFCKLRHKMMEDTGLSEGIIYSILVTHDWYRLDANFRRNAIVTCFLSVSPLDIYSRREYSRFLGEEGVTFLANKLSKALRFDEFKGEGLVVLPPDNNLSSLQRVGRLTWTNVQDVEYIEIKYSKSGRLAFKEVK